MCGVCVRWCLLLVGNGGEEDERREGERGICLAVPVPVPVLSPSPNTHTHTHKHPYPHTPTLMHTFPPSFPPSLSPLAGLACCHLLPLSSSSSPPSHNRHTHKCMALAARCFPLNTPLTPKEEEKERGEEYSTQPSSHAAQAHHTPLHAINNENKAGKRKKEKKNRCWK